MLGAVEYCFIPKPWEPDVQPVPEYLPDDNMNLVKVEWLKCGPQMSADALDSRHRHIARVAGERCSPRSAAS